MPSPADLAADLAAEHATLDEVVARIGPQDWDRRTPAEGWSIKDSISHLAYFDRTARLSIVDPDGYAAHARSIEPGADTDLGRTLTAESMLEAWREARRALLSSVASLRPGTRLQWYGRAMSPASFLTARLMETWAHGVDVTDTFGWRPSASRRLRHVVDLGVRARSFAFAAHRVDDPGAPVRVVATGPAGEAWTWGEEGGDRLAGSALDLALLFTQRRHPDDLDLEVDGRVAAQWTAVAQAFAGPAGPGRTPLGRARGSRRS